MRSYGPFQGALPVTSRVAFDVLVLQPYPCAADLSLCAALVPILWHEGTPVAFAVGAGLVALMFAGPVLWKLHSSGSHSGSSANVLFSCSLAHWIALACFIKYKNK